MGKDNVVVKKVSPYPINAVMSVGSQQARGQILKLTLMGFLMDLGGSVVQVGQYIGVAFELPTLQVFIRDQVRVIKTYDRFQQGNGGAMQIVPVDPSSQSAPGGSAKMKVQRIAEMHFTQIGEEDKKNIRRFLKAIGQPGVA